MEGEGGEGAMSSAAEGISSPFSQDVLTELRRASALSSACSLPQLWPHVLAWENLVTCECTGALGHLTNAFQP